jgi:hypothetical protein
METQGLGTGHIDPFWNDEYKQLNYRQEKFNNPKDLTRWRSEGYVHPDSHFTGAMCDMRSPQPSWNSQIISWAASTFNIADIGTNYYCMSTGVILPLHQDIYSRYIELFGCKLDDIVRILVMPEDWCSGHYLELAGVAYTNWRAGDYFWWYGDTPHMAANIGTANRYTIQITGHVNGQ